MQRIHVKQVDTFTTVPNTGNPAGVVFDGKELTEHQMKAIARELNLTETAFVLPSTKREADLRMRFFSALGEVPPSGHATIGVFHALAEQEKMGMEKDGRYNFRLETNIGIMPVDVTKDQKNSSVMIGLRIPAFDKVTHYKVDLLRVLDLRPAEFEGKFPITRGDILFVPIKRLHTLFTLRPNYLAMAHFLEQKHLRGMSLFTTETIDRESIVHSRFFAPHLGVNEDPVTATAQAQLSVCLFEFGVLDLRDGRCVYQGEQGDAMGRRGRVSIELNVDDQKPVSVKVGGSAVTILEGDMLIQE